MLHFLPLCQQLGMKPTACMAPIIHMTMVTISIGYITRWRSLCDLHTEDQRSEAM